MNKRLAAFLVLPIVLALAFVGLVGAPATAAPPAGNEEIVNVHGSVASSGAAIVSAVTGKKVVLLGAVLQSDTAGVLVIQDGSGGATKISIYLPANTNVYLGPEELGGGVSFTAATAVHATLASAAIHGVLKIRKEL